MSYIKNFVLAICCLSLLMIAQMAVKGIHDIYQSRTPRWTLITYMYRPNGSAAVLPGQHAVKLAHSTAAFIQALQSLRNDYTNSEIIVTGLFPLE